MENIGWSILRIFVPSLHGGIYQSLAQRSIYDIGAISTPETRSPREDWLRKSPAQAGLGAMPSEKQVSREVRFASLFTYRMQYRSPMSP